MHVRNAKAITRSIIEDTRDSVAGCRKAFPIDEPPVRRIADDSSKITVYIPTRGEVERRHRDERVISHVFSIGV